MNTDELSLPRFDVPHDRELPTLSAEQYAKWVSAHQAMLRRHGQLDALLAAPSREPVDVRFRFPEAD